MGNDSISGVLVSQAANTSAPTQQGQFKSQDAEIITQFRCYAKSVYTDANFLNVSGDALKKLTKLTPEELKKVLESKTCPPCDDKANKVLEQWNKDQENRSRMYGYDDLPAPAFRAPHIVRRVYTPPFKDAFEPLWHIRADRTSSGLAPFDNDVNKEKETYLRIILTPNLEDVVKKATEKEKTESKADLFDHSRDKFYQRPPNIKQ